MSFLSWMALASGVLLVMALASSYLRSLPITTSVLYLALGVALGPVGFAIVSLDLRAVAEPLEMITEIAVIVALFVGGLKLRLRWRAPEWRAAFWLAGPAMVLTLAGVAALAHLALGLSLPASLLLGAVLAPTDPVLASTVTVNDAKDHDLVRYGISGEAGLNDGTAFPFVVLALAWETHGAAGAWLVEWGLVRVLWAVPAALVLGYALGRGIGWVAIRLRTHQRDSTAPSDLLALALIGIAYVLSDAIGAWGFLGVFAAGLGLRAAEVTIVASDPHPDVEPSPAAHPPAEDLVEARVEDKALAQPSVAAGVLVHETLSFGDTIERLVEVAMIVAVGVALVTHWDWRAVPLSFALFVVIRPLAVRVCLAFTPTSTTQRWLIGWFGIRGIGSLYYLAYALHLGRGPAANDITNLVVSTVALSVVVHGISSTPLLAWYERSLAKGDPQ